LLGCWPRHIYTQGVITCMLPSQPWWRWWIITSHA
jgi:hypothetical protein